MVATCLLCRGLLAGELVQFMQHHGRRMGEVEGAIGRARAKAEEPPGLQHLVVGEAPILPAKDHRHWGVVGR